MDIRFNCPHCGQHLSVDERGAGITVNCPSCKGQTEIPSSTPPPSPPPPLPPPIATVRRVPTPAKGRLTTCRDCGHAISSKATNCPACGAPVKRGTTARAVLISIASILILVLILVLIGQQLGDSSSSAKNPVKTQVGLTASAVAVTNLEEQTWPAVTVYLNGTP